MSDSERSRSEVLGDWIVQCAEHVEDMGDRVKRVLTQDPRDHHYASRRLESAVQDAVKALALVGWGLEEVEELVRDAHQNGLRYKRNLARGRVRLGSRVREGRGDVATR
jgi:hypothetical protein